MAFIKIYIRHVWYSSLEYTESDKSDSWVPILEFGINIPKYSEITISGNILESIFQIQILEIRSPKVKFCQIMLPQQHHLVGRLSNLLTNKLFSIQNNKVQNRGCWFFIYNETWFYGLTPKVINNILKSQKIGEEH